MAIYYHGVRVKENPTKLPAPVNTTSGIQVVVGVAPVNMADDPAGAVNKPVVAYSYEEAVAAVGYCEDFADYNICQSIYASFELEHVAPVIFINVLDPAKHKKTLESAEYAVTNGAATIDTFGVIPDSLTVTGDAELEKDVDYVVSFDDNGYAVISLVEPGETTSLTISGEVIDPTQITAEDIIGSYDVETGEETGLEAIRLVFPLLQLVPGAILSPGWSKDPNVAAAIDAKCRECCGIFKCESYIDLDTEKAAKYTDVEDAKNECGFNSEHELVLWPCVKADDKILYSSAVRAAIEQACDYDNDNMPSVSASNHDAPITGICLEDGTEIALDELQANVVNSYGVATWINFLGWKSWGSNSAAYPENTDPKDRWFNIRRFFSWYGNQLILNYHENVDDPINTRLIDAIVDSENVRGNSYVAQGKLAGLSIEWRQDENPIEDIINGKMQFYIMLAPYPPAEDILFELEFDPSMIEAELSGGEE